MLHAVTSSNMNTLLVQCNISRDSDTANTAVMKVDTNDDYDIDNTAVTEVETIGETEDTANTVDTSGNSEDTANPVAMEVKKIKSNSENTGNTAVKKVDTSDNSDTDNDTPTSKDSTDDDIYFIFPSPQERIKYYMGKWFDAPALNKESCADILIADTSTADRADAALLYTQEVLDAILKESPDGRLNRYQRDAQEVLNSFKPNGSGINNSVVIRFGDEHGPSLLPVVSKARNVGADNEVDIIWPLNIICHFGKLENLKKTQDTPWEEKKDAIVWRGDCTGKENKRLRFVEKYAPQQNDDIDIFFDPKCVQTRNVDATFTKPLINLEEMLKYKYLLSLEGNDVASGLKWQLASSSVVFMPKPTAETYAMEGLLVPFVHYIPVKSDGSDVEDMMAWAKKNDKKARWISEQASMYMDKLWVSHEAQENNNFIYGELAKNYHEKFGGVLKECLEEKQFK